MFSKQFLGVVTEVKTSREFVNMVKAMKAIACRSCLLLAAPCSCASDAVATLKQVLTRSLSHSYNTRDYCPFFPGEMGKKLLS